MVATLLSYRTTAMKVPSKDFVADKRLMLPEDERRLDRMAVEECRNRANMME